MNENLQPLKDLDGAIGVEGPPGSSMRIALDP